MSLTVRSGQDALITDFLAKVPLEAPSRVARNVAL